MYVHTFILNFDFNFNYLSGQKRKLDEEDEDDCTMSLYESWQFIYQFYIECLIKEKICEPDTRVNY